MLVKKEYHSLPDITPEQMEMLKKAQQRPITFDEDSPELTEEELKKFRRVQEANRLERNKQTVTLRLSPQALKTARSLGKGYTSVLSRILESALSDSETIQRYL